MPVIETPSERPAGALFRVLREVGADPDLAFEAVEEVGFRAGQNVVAEIGVRIERLEHQFETRVEQLQTETAARFDVVNTRFDALEGGIETLQELLWPLVISLPDYPPVPAKVKRR